MKQFKIDLMPIILLTATILSMNLIVHAAGGDKSKQGIEQLVLNQYPTALKVNRAPAFEVK